MFKLVSSVCITRFILKIEAGEGRDYIIWVPRHFNQAAGRLAKVFSVYPSFI